MHKGRLCRLSIEERPKAAALSVIETFRQLLGNDCALLRLASKRASRIPPMTTKRTTSIKSRLTPCFRVCTECNCRFWLRSRGASRFISPAGGGFAHRHAVASPAGRRHRQCASDCRSGNKSANLSTCTDVLAFLTSLVEEVSEIAGPVMSSAL